MRRHLPYLLALGKGLLLVCVLSGLSLAGWFSGFSALLEDRLWNWSWLQIPVFWMMLISGNLLLVFPLTLAEDHLVRAFEGIREEAPAWHWIRGFAVEVVLATLAGTLATVLMEKAPGSWWLLLAVLWTAYVAFQPRLQEMLLVSNDEEEPHESLPELLAELSPVLANAGAEISEVRVLSEEKEELQLHPDVHLLHAGRETVLLLPREWAHTWTVPEIAAVALHRSWMDRRSQQARELSAQAISALTCLGGYALLFPLLRAPLGLDAIHALEAIPVFVLWMLASLFSARIAVLAFSRQWLCMADDAVAGSMSSPEGLLAALRRARAEAPADEMPGWAEVLFSNAPSLDRRIKRLEDKAPQP